jgi:hypothetical protein
MDDDVYASSKEVPAKSLAPLLPGQSAPSFIPMQVLNAATVLEVRDLEDRIVG